MMIFFDDSIVEGPPEEKDSDSDIDWDAIFSGDEDDIVEITEVPATPIRSASTAINAPNIASPFSSSSNDNARRTRSQSIERSAGAAGVARSKSTTSSIPRAGSQYSSYFSNP